MPSPIADPLGEAVGIAEPKAAPVPDYLAAQPPGLAPGMGVTAPGIPAAQILSGGTSVDLARQAAELVPPPDPAQVRDAGNAYADAIQDYKRTGEGYEKAYQARADEVELAAKQYEQRARELLPQTAGVQPAPPRSLRGFLAPTENEDPYTTVSKFMQSVSLLATMMGGGRNGARASVSALTGAVEGWTKGDRYRAESEYQTWKDTTEALFRQFDDEMRRYNSIMIAERVPLEQKLRALETTAWQQKNAMAQKAFEVGTAKDARDHLQKMTDAAVQAQFHAATIQGQEERARQNHEALLLKIDQQNDQLSKQLAAKFAGQDVQLKIAEMNNARQLQALQQKIDSGANLQKASPAEKKITDEFVNNESILSKVDELLKSGKVDLPKIVGGINPWMNKLVQKWGRADSPLPPEGETSGPIDRKLIKGRLTPEEEQFLVLIKNYGDLKMRQRSGKAITGFETDSFLQFGLDPSLSPQTLRTRINLERETNMAGLQNHINNLKLYRTYTPEVSELIPARIGGGKPAAPGAAANDPLGIR